MDGISGAALRHESGEACGQGYVGKHAELPA